MIRLALLALGTVTLAAVALSGGDPLAAAVPVVAAAFLWAMWRAPLKLCVLSVMFFSLIADAPQDNPMGDLWRSPLYSVGRVLCNNWSKSYGISALPFSGMDVLCVLLLLRLVFRRRASTQMAGVIWTAMAALIASIAGLGLWGALQSGEPGIAYWQVRQLVYIPVFIFLLAEALTGPQDYRLLAPVILAAALVKAADGAFFYFAIARPQDLSPAYVTSHADTMLFCLSIALVAIRWLEQPDARSLLRCLWFIPLVMAAIWLNNRRIAYVGLGASLALVWACTRRNAAKRSLARLALLAAPLAALYVLAGWSSDEPWFKPVASIRTVIEADKDPSTRSREIENFNLSRTLRQHPLGMGLGAPYEQFEKGPDISESFTLWRYIPHNSVLWMMAAGGPLGFVLFWMPFIVGMYLAARAHRFARSPLERASALAAMCAVLLFLIQAYGDMGTQSWSTAWLLSAALAVAGRLSLTTGAWGPALQLETA